VYYRNADPATYELCDLVCGQIQKRYARRAHVPRLFAQTAARARRPRR
jgi:hypothetical protein